MAGNEAETPTVLDDMQQLFNRLDDESLNVFWGFALNGAEGIVKLTHSAEKLIGYIEYSVSESDQDKKKIRDRNARAAYSGPFRSLILF